MFKVIEETGRAWLKEVDFKIVRSIQEIRDYYADAPSKYLGSDFEWNSANIEKGKIVGYSLSKDGHSARYAPTGHQIGPEYNLPTQEVLSVLKEIDEKFRTVWWHYRSDSEATIRNYGWEFQNYEDAMFAYYLENPNFKSYALKESGRRRYQLDVIDYEEVAQGMTLDLRHPLDLVDYACQDAWLALRMWNEPGVQAAIKEQAFTYKLEWQGMYEIRQGEMNKTYLSLEKLHELKADCDRRIKAALAQIYELAGGEFKVDSPAVLGPKLIELGVPITEQTQKTKQPETKTEVLEKYKSYHPVIPQIIQYKKLTTQSRNYIDKMIGAVEHFGPAVRFPFHQIGVPTGRMKAGGEGNKAETYSKGVVPINIQSLPDHEKEDYLPNIRSAVVSNLPGEDDFVLVAVDYSQVELRIAANLSREPTWIKTFSEGGDIHLTNAKLAYRDYKMGAKDPRRKRGKTMSFAILYGGSEYTVAQHGNISIEQGKMLVENFFAGAPALKAWIDGWINMARQQKYVKTYFGRKRPLDEYYVGEGRPGRDGKIWPKDRAMNWLWQKGDREAVNDPIQGGAADVFKIGMVKLGKLIRSRNWQQDVQQTLWIHDEFVLRIRKSMLDLVIPEIVKTLEFDVKGWPVPLKVDVEIGENWGELLPWKVYKAIDNHTQAISLAPWNNSKEELWDKHGLDIFKHLDIETEESEKIEMDRSAYGY